DLSIQEEELALLNFFQRAGVLFDADPGPCLAFDGTQLIVTQTPRNLQRLRNILRRYQETKQVEIEAKFMEVQQGALEELGFQWNVTHGSSTYQTQALNSSASALRSLGGAFSTQGTTAGDGSITFANGAPAMPLSNSPPAFPNNINLWVGTPNIANILGVTDGWRVNLIIKALEQKTGTDLMSAPKLTVLSGKTAEIVVAQEMRYPQSYGKINSAVGTSNSTLVTGGSAGVTITAGTPQDFTVREVGVQMQVTPTVEDDNESISLRLEPEVTEFEGFVEYGGSSVAIASGTTVNVPSGFFQPIFSVRRIQTEVTIYDGATVIMGGLTREQVKEVDDRVPVLGNIPLLGRLFRSKGETSQKRNLLIFVTANMISPGGAPSRQMVNNVPPGGLFQNPVIVTPAGATQRGQD
ncbi:MAG TPA: type II secretory pathway, component PulD, partial [Opitutae bacterium]|nr:type II secretory pathway, component PulD [Opitutae bacterium]